MNKIRIVPLAVAALALTGAYLLFRPIDSPLPPAAGGNTAPYDRQRRVDEAESAGRAKAAIAEAKPAYQSQPVIVAASRRASVTEPLPHVDAPLVATEF